MGRGKRTKAGRRRAAAKPTFQLPPDPSSEEAEGSGDDDRSTDTATETEVTGRSRRLRDDDDEAPPADDGEDDDSAGENLAHPGVVTPRGGSENPPAVDGTNEADGAMRGGGVTQLPHAGHRRLGDGLAHPPPPLPAGGEGGSQDGEQLRRR